MNSSIRKPIVLAFAGPNGSGKTTIMRSLSTFGTYINADDLRREYNLTNLEAAQQTELLLDCLIDKKADFSFETVLSTERKLLLLEKARDSGYEVQSIYVLTCDENINIARVGARHRAGGHDVPEDKIRTRYHRALKLLPSLIEICDKILIFDNSDKPSLIFRKENAYSEIIPNTYWSRTKIKELLGI